MLIFNNPHTKNFFWQTVADFILRNNISKRSQKYKYILDYLWKNNLYFWLFINYQESSLPNFMKNKILLKLEIYLWLLIKKINPFRVKLYDNLNKINKSDIFFSFSLKILDTEYNWIDDITNKDFIKLFHFTHYVQNTSLIEKNFSRLKWDFIIAENNLSNSKYFKYFFKNYKKNVYTLPFTFGNRYKNINDFKNRKNLCISVWAVININDYKWLFEDFYSFYNTDTLQPIRKEVLDKEKELFAYIDTINSEFKLEYKWDLLNKIKKLLFWMKHSYFKFDIVKKFNNYKMFICWEEINDLPWIWFIEWMACWCAYIWKIDSMYTDLWFIPWIHYIWHNWTLEDIIEKISYYQKNESELEKIAKTWYEYVIENFSWERVADIFYKDLLKLSEDYKNSWYIKNNLNFNCSFIKW